MRASERAGPVTLLQHRTGILVPYDVSPDDKWLVLANLRERQEDLFVMKTDGTELSRVTDDPARDRSPRFSPDGAMLTFFSNKSGHYQGWFQTSTSHLGCRDIQSSRPGQPRAPTDVL